MTRPGARTVMAAVALAATLVLVVVAAGSRTLAPLSRTGSVLRGPVPRGSFETLEGVAMSRPQVQAVVTATNTDPPEVEDDPVEGAGAASEPVSAAVPAAVPARTVPAAPDADGRVEPKPRVRREQPRREPVEQPSRDPEPSRPEPSRPRSPVSAAPTEPGDDGSTDGGGRPDPGDGGAPGNGEPVDGGEKPTEPPEDVEPTEPRPAPVPGPLVPPRFPGLPRPWWGLAQDS